MLDLNSFDAPAAAYSKNGYAVLNLLDTHQQQTIEKFATEWIYSLLKPWIKEPHGDYPLNNYHIWSRELPAEHRSVFKALNRYQYPEPKVRDAIINEKMTEFLASIGLKKYKVWDDGWGDVGFRLIRPGMKDGYPFCAKDWGIAKGVVSFWIPVIGRSKNEVLAIVPSSHLKDQPTVVRDDQFAKGEPRFAGNIDSLEIVRPELEQGQVICYHSRTIHSEDVTQSDSTRINLEIRFQPV